MCLFTENNHCGPGKTEILLAEKGTPENIIENRSGIFG
jgi:hypothetical protein